MKNSVAIGQVSEKSRPEKEPSRHYVGYQVSQQPALHSQSCVNMVQ